MPPTDLPFAAPGTMAALFRSVARRHAPRPAIIAPGVRLSFAELDARSDALARRLREQSVGPTTIVGTLLLDGAAMVELLLATAKLGATILAMNWRLAPAELRRILDDASPTLLFVSDCFADQAREAVHERALVVLPSDGTASVADMLGGSDSPSPPAPSNIRPDHDWLLLYSSGTTGQPKGCRHVQGGYYVNTLSYSERAGFRDYDRALLSQPLFHVGGIHNFLAVHAAGGCGIIPRRGLDHQETLALVSAEAVTFQTVPILDPRGYMAAHQKRALPNRLRLLHGGGGMHAPALLRDLAATFDADMMLGYGQTEAGGLISVLSLAEQLERPTSCGRPLAHVRTQIVDERGREMSCGEAGELLIEAASIMVGYLHWPDATDEALAHGWLRTGDIFRQDTEGYLHFAGRSKEMIKSAGENVYPAEVEAAILLHPAVAECCVVGVPNALYGEAVKAFIVLAEGAEASPHQIGDWCRAHVAGYKRPRYVEFIDVIPRDFQSKPQRAPLARRPVSENQTTDAPATSRRRARK